MVKRWDDILDNGTDAELVRLTKELTDRAEGRAGEQQAAPVVEIPDTLAKINRMTQAEVIAALRQVEDA